MELAWMARRWWRWLTNPTPQCGQEWIVDGYGPVEVTEVKPKYAWGIWRWQTVTLSGPMLDADWAASALRSQGRPNW